jgi:hypothetical protein
MPTPDEWRELRQHRKEAARDKLLSIIEPGQIVYTAVIH